MKLGAPEFRCVEFCVGRVVAKPNGRTVTVRRVLRVSSPVAAVRDKIRLNLVMIN